MNNFMMKYEIHRFAVSILLMSSIMLSGCFERKGCCDHHHDEATVKTLLKKDSSIKPVVVVGGGVAGLTAANYLLQANIPCVVLEGPKPGGALAQSDSVRNWPGVLNAPGSQITQSLRQQVVDNGGDVQPYSLEAIDSKKWPFVLSVRTETGELKTVRTFACVVAMGTEPNYLGVPGETGVDGYWGRGVTNCAVCDGALFKNKTVAVVGGGDSAMVEAAYLAGLAKKVYVIMRAGTTRANDLRKVKMVEALPQVSFIRTTNVTAIEGANGVVTNLKVINNQTQETSALAVDGVFLAIGSTPNTTLLKSQCQLDKAGYVVLKTGQQTNVHGLFAAGDICDPHLKQAVTASAMGCSAALQAKAFLEERGYEPALELDEQTQAWSAVVVDQHDHHHDHDHSHAEWVTKIASLSNATDLIKEVEGKLMVVDVYGDFCMPCKKMMPIVEALAQYYDHQVCFTKLDIASRSFDANEFARLVQTEPIMQVPTFLFIKNGKVVKRTSGSMAKDDFMSLIEQYK